MKDLIKSTVISLMQKAEFKIKLETHLNKIMEDGQITLKDLPDLVFFLVECYNNISSEKLSLNDIPIFIRRLVTYIISENNIIPDEQEKAFLNLVEVAIKLVMVQPKIKKFCLNNLICCKS